MPYGMERVLELLLRLPEYLCRNLVTLVEKFLTFIRSYLLPFAAGVLLACFVCDAVGNLLGVIVRALVLAADVCLTLGLLLDVLRPFEGAGIVRRVIASRRIEKFKSFLEGFVFGRVTHCAIRVLVQLLPPVSAVLLPTSVMSTVSRLFDSAFVVSYRFYFGSCSYFVFVAYIAMRLANHFSARLARQ